jgi:predicted type IV restriction endonuclease
LLLTQRQARQQIDGLIQKYPKIAKPNRQAITEAGVVHQFLDPLFAALGWPVDDPQRYKYELHTAAGRPDMTLIPEQGGTLYVEAKRFGVIQDLQQARHTRPETARRRCISRPA